MSCWQPGTKVSEYQERVMKLMKMRILFLLLMVVSGPLGVWAQVEPGKTSGKPAQSPQSTEVQPATSRAPQIDRKKLALADRPNLTLEDVNTVIGIDKRVIVMMAALNVAGYDYESGGRALSVIRQQLREDLKGIRPELVQRLRYHFQSHRKAQADAAAVAPYLSLALSRSCTCPNIS